MEFKVGTVVMRETERLRVSSIRPEVSQIVLEGSRGEQFVRSVDEFNTDVAGGKLKPLFANQAARLGQLPSRQLTENERRHLDRRIELLQVLDRLEPDTRWSERMQVLREYCEAGKLNVPSQKTLNRWVALRHSGLGPEILAPRLSARGRKIPTFDDDPFEEIIMDEIIQCYCKTEKYGRTQITDFVNNKCRDFAEKSGIEFRGISRRSVSRRIQKLAYYLIKPGKVDSATFNQDMRVALKAIFTERPYERVEIDAAKLPVFCVDANGIVIGRPWLYAAIDCASSTPIIIVLSIQPPSQEFVLRALEFAFTPKGLAFSEKYGLRNQWPAPAAIERVVLDNAVEHHGGAVLSALRFLGITVDYPQAAKPQHKPFIERFFKTLNDSLLYALPGSVKNRVQPDSTPTEKAIAEARLTVEEVEQQIMKWAADVYMQQPLYRLEERFGPRTSPARALTMLKQQHVVLPPPDPERFRAACLRYNSQLMTLSREGVCCDGEKFQSPALGALYRELGPKQKVEVRYNPLDCTEVSVVHPRDPQQVIQAFNRRPGMPRISFDDARAARRRNYRSDAEMSGEQYHQDHIEQLRAFQNQSKSRRMQDRNRAARGQARAAAARELDQAAIAPNTTSPVTAPATTIAAPRRKKGSAQ
ncbi:Mu transposase C-terminal domain-containing protein [Pseudomonas aeruginosa]